MITMTMTMTMQLQPQRERIYHRQRRPAEWQAEQRQLLRVLPPPQTAVRLTSAQ
jgi:hypothetical protein